MQHFLHLLCAVLYKIRRQTWFLLHDVVFVQHQIMATFVQVRDAESGRGVCQEIHAVLPGAAYGCMAPAGSIALLKQILGCQMMGLQHK